MGIVGQVEPASWRKRKPQHHSGVGPFITARARERQAYTKREQFQTRTTKRWWRRGSVADWSWTGLLRCPPARHGTD